MTLRAAIREAKPGGTIMFDRSLNGGTILLELVGSDNSVLQGEIYSGMTFQGYGERNYGRSALYAAKDLTIDASALPDGITLTWTGGDPNRARVLAVYGNLTMRNVTVTSGYSSAEAIAGGRSRTRWHAEAGSLSGEPPRSRGAPSAGTGAPGTTYPAGIAARTAAASSRTASS